MSVSRKLAVVGARAVGKSSLTLRFTENRFDDSYYPTIENQYMRKFEVNGKVYDVDISDTAGQDEYSIISQRSLIGIHGFVLVYSIASRSSFEILSSIREKILNMLVFGDADDDSDSNKIPFILVGNKTDLGNDLRQVSTQEGQELAKKFGCPFIEVSVKNNDNVNKVFESLLIHIEEIENPQEKKGGCVIV